MKQLAPSILSADFICLGEQLKQLQKLCIHYLHIDVMDGMFVPSISFGMPVIASLRKHTDMFFDVHLMIEEPIRYVNALRQAGADGLTVHAEACTDLPGTIAAIRESGAKPAVCLSPKTPLSKLDGILDQVDMVLIMGVEPGFGGQTLIWDTLEKVKQLHKIRKEQGLFFKIEIDGGVTKENARAVAACGVDIVVAGTAVFRGDIEENIHVLQEETRRDKMLLENIPLGRTLEIYIDREGYRYRLVSKVEEAKSNQVCVSLIASNGRAFQFHAEDDICIVYRDADRLWEWTKVKAGIAKLDGEPVHIFQINDKGHSYNRRNAYRVQIGEETLIGYYDVPGAPRRLSEPPSPADEEENADVIEEIEPEIVRGVIKDVSESGVGLYSDFEFQLEDGMFFDIPSPYGMLHCRAEVVRRDELRATNHKFNFYYGCEMTMTDRKLMKYIYDIQIDILKKTRGQ